MKRLLASFLLPTLIPAALAAQTDASTRLTLQEAARRALQNNPVTARAREELDIARTQVNLTRSSILPRVEATGRGTLYDREVTLDTGGGDPIELLPSVDWSYAISLRQPIYAGGRELKAIKQARLAVDSTDEALRLNEDALLLGVASNYLGVTTSDALVEVERQNVELAERRRFEATAFYEAGEVTRVDILRADAAVKAALRRLAAAEQLRESAASLLRLDLALDEMDNPVAMDAPAPLALPEVPSEEVLVDRAVSMRPEVRRAAIAVEQAELEVAKQKGAYLPVLTAEASFNQQRSGFPTDQFGALTFNVTVPIWTSGETSARVATARARQQQAELAYDEVRRAAREDVRRSLVGLTALRTNLELARQQLEAAQAEYEQVLELYRAQEATSLDLQEAENALAEARRAVVVGAADRDLAALQVFFAAGQIKPVLVGGTLE